MQMTLTLSFDNEDEVAPFFASFATAFSQFKTALQTTVSNSIAKPSAKTTTDVSESQDAPIADQLAADGEEAIRARRTGTRKATQKKAADAKAAEADFTDEPKTETPATAVPVTAPTASAKKPKQTKEELLLQMSKTCNTIATEKEEGITLLNKVMAHYSIKSFKELDLAKLEEVDSWLQRILIGDEIPF